MKENKIVYIETQIMKMNKNSLYTLDWGASPLFKRIYIYDLDYKYPTQNTVIYMPFRLASYKIINVKNKENLPLIARWISNLN